MFNKPFTTNILEIALFLKVFLKIALELQYTLWLYFTLESKEIYIHDLRILNHPVYLELGKQCYLILWVILAWNIIIK